MEFEQVLASNIENILIEKDRPLSEMTTLRVGGKAAYTVYVDTAAQAAAVFSLAEQAGLPCFIMGNGSNLLFTDAGYPGVIVQAGKAMSTCRVEGNQLICGAGALLSRAAKLAAENALSGFEALSGIPGTIGGAVYMNAGAYGGEVSQVLHLVTVLEEGIVKQYTAEEMHFSYRHSLAMERPMMILEAVFHLTPGDPALITGAMREFNSRRREKQPLEYPSAGSFFKRPEGHFAGALIEQCGLKGFTVGGAQVSEKHAGFVINRGGATAQDILTLMHAVQRRVFDETGVHLEPEVRIIGGEE